jgi:WD40 repeat protein
MLEMQTTEYDAYRVKVAALLADEDLKNFGPARALLTVMQGIGDRLPPLPEIKRAGYRTLAQLRDQRIMPDHKAPVRYVEFAPRKPILMTVSQNGILRFWRVDTGELIDDYKISARFLTARWRTDGEQLYVWGRGTDSQFLVPCSREKLRPYFSECSATTEDIIRSFNQEAGVGTFSPDGRWIVTSSFFTTTKLWDVAAIDKPKRDLGKTWSFLTGGAFSHDSQRLALASISGEIQIFRVRDNLEQETPRPETELGQHTLGGPAEGSQATEQPALVYSLAFHPSNPNLLLATYRDGVVRLWNIAEKREEKQLRLTERSRAYQGVFNHDGTWAATAHEDRVVRLWPLRAAEPVAQVLRGHGGPVMAVDFSPDGKMLASGSNDRTARLWSQRPALGRTPTSARGSFSESTSGKVPVRAEPGTDRLIVTYNNLS